MKWLSIVLMSSSLWAQVEIKQLPIVKIYVPQGFDSNDSSQVIVSGYLPDLCYKSPRHTLERSGNRFTLSVEGSYVPDTTEEGCLNMPVPFLEEVTLGELAEGVYKIGVKGNNNKSSDVELVVKRALTKKRDEFIYADVKFIDETDANRKISLVGYHPNDCLELDKIEMITNGTDTLSLLPVLKISSDVCSGKRTPFEYEYEVPVLENMARGVLIHVRVMDGRSVNHLFQNKLTDSVPELAFK